MAKKKILTIPNSILRKVSEPVTKIDTETKKLMDNMLETMYAAPGIGLAAVQIGVLKRVIVIDLSKADEKKEPLFIINPESTLPTVADDDNTINGSCTVTFCV